MKTNTYYEISDGDGYLTKNGYHHFNSEAEAIEAAKEFKANPRSHNERMSDENVAYWQRKNYTIFKKTVITEELQTI